jgi:hypothetical protein
MLVPNGTLAEVVERRRDRWWYVRLLPFGQEAWALSGHGSRRSIECCRTGLGDARPISLDEPVGFKTPTNVYCVLEDPWLRCDIKQISGAAPVKPADCFLDWGDAFFLEPISDESFVICHGDTVINDALPMLPYGKTWSQEGYTCTSEKTGLKCTNLVSHGFTLSRTSQRDFDCEKVEELNAAGHFLQRHYEHDPPHFRHVIVSTSSSVGAYNVVGIDRGINHVGNADFCDHGFA